jgi:CheY-like chemotaxis protein
MPGDEFKILVAEDSALYTVLLKESLSSQPYTLVFAKNGCEAIELFAEHKPPLVITDWVNAQARRVAAVPAHSR